jgi:hypothetical protein
LEPDKFWLSTPVATNIETIPVPAPPSTTLSRATLFVPNPPPTQPWQWQPPYNIQLNVPSPTQLYAISGLWAPDPVPVEFWQITFQRNAVLNPPVVQQPFYKLWRYDLVPPTDWLGTPQAAHTLQALDYKPFHRLWRWDLVPDQFWLGQPVPSNIEFIPAPTVTLPFSKLWRWDHVPAPDWVGTPQSSNILRQLTHATPYHRLWQWNIEPDKFWLGTPVAPFIKNIPPPLVLPFSQKQWQWAYTYDPPPPWIWTPPYPSPYVPPIPPPPPPIPRRPSIKNLFPPNLTYTVANPNTSLPTPSRTSPLVKVYVNEPATVYLAIYDVAPVEYQVSAASVLLQFIRPDGSFYYVIGSPYTYIAQVNGFPFIIYTSAVGEFNQVGWWTAVFTIGTAQSQQFAFYIHAPGQ